MQDRNGTFEMEYSLFTNAEAGSATQFGMDFTLTQRNGYALCQLIFPAVAVGTNLANQWNIDNHRSSGRIDSLYFSGAGTGTIRDVPREIAGRQRVLTTTFAVFMINKETNTIYTKGVSFGYWIDTSVANPVTKYSEMKDFNMDHEQKSLIKRQYPNIKFG
jgi:hypothetical protein